MFIDTHAHLSYPDFAEELDEAIARAGAAGVEKIVSIGPDLEAARRTLDIAHRFDGVYATVGLHPGEVPDLSLGNMPELGALAKGPKVVAIGETGLDYYRLPVGQASPPVHSEARPGETSAVLKQQQKDLFWAQLELAKERRLPVVIHNRAADVDTLEILRAHAGGLPKDWRPWGVMHCFSGDEKFAFDCLEIGLFISYTGILTFKNAVGLRNVAKKVSLDRVMLETDAPYLAPQPHRGKRNEPAYVPLIAETLALVKGVSVEEVARATTENAHRLFRFNHVE
ncbi:MAG TPA: TatD family hydrolase [Verrucomicrobiae bacterium]|nr:TatD family hydrolase [Verrucomicrobiae bacterium]